MIETDMVLTCECFGKSDNVHVLVVRVEGCRWVAYSRADSSMRTLELPKMLSAAHRELFRLGILGVTECEVTNQAVLLDDTLEVAQVEFPTRGPTAGMQVWSRLPEHKQDAIRAALYPERGDRWTIS